jgi:hypothetical protein
VEARHSLLPAAVASARWRANRTFVIPSRVLLPAVFDRLAPVLAERLRQRVAAAAHDLDFQRQASAMASKAGESGATEEQLALAALILAALTGGAGGGARPSENADEAGRE